MIQLRQNIVLPIFVLLFSLTTAAQNDNAKYDSKLVVFNSSDLVGLLESIVTTKNTCGTSNIVNWYIDLKEPSSATVSQGRIANLIELTDSESREIYTTLINNKVVFILANDKEKFFSDTGFVIDLSDYVNKSVIVFEDFSHWMINIENDSYSISAKRIWKCN
ncbi:hypothetical protein IWQ47_002341 [Aquimarina sp. EL_43]|uniref:hypothetical protein n=1 Tax=unclassified Aquimarina TaxID=2627091 RepID=UPI0018C9EEE7|nr:MULTISPECIES: hypothetical protein [unclassified Aquimarina]MBG6130871.1 hypothetical protein [Aquimarina sp. EL_35]MBG6151330.1 hypothetical protein [Aquimarina sp. EL_32]MBG6169261.1 hypothetical protein [Aquimarina sp. EL_43]